MIKLINILALILLFNVNNLFSEDFSKNDLSGFLVDQVKIIPRKGLMLYIGASNIQTIDQMSKNTLFQIQGVVSERELAEKLRLSLLGNKNAERISIVWRRTKHLPYLDNLVDFIVIENWGKNESKDIALNELLRILCPKGEAIIGSDTDLNITTLLAEAEKEKLVKVEKLNRKGAWIKITKLVDPAFGVWSGGSVQGSNVVSTDQVIAPNKEVRWISTPTYGGAWSTYNNIDHGNYSPEFFANGLSYHTEVEMVSPLLKHYFLVARNPFNGCVQWKIKVPSQSRIVAVDEKSVFYNDGKDLLAASSETGEIIKNYGQGVTGRYNISALDKLVVSVYVPLAAIDKESGKKLWSHAYYQNFSPVVKDKVVYLGGTTIEALNLDTGELLWKVSPTELSPKGGVVKTIMEKSGNLYLIFDFAENEKAFTRIVALDAKSGKTLWVDTRERRSLILMPFDDQVWLASEKTVDKAILYFFTVLDTKTGKEIKSLSAPKGTGCWQVRATENYIIWSRSNFIDRKTFAMSEQFGVRSSCGVGPTPAYGLMNFSPHTCNCYVALRGVYALSGGSKIANGSVLPQLIKGTNDKAADVTSNENDWPIYRGNGARSNSSKSELPTQLKKVWSIKLGDSALPQATGAAGIVFVAVETQNRVVAIDLVDGKEKWSYATEGRVAIPPTYYNGVCLFGDHNGWVYCVNASSGKLIWQLQAAPEQKYMCAYGVIESSWPVKSGVIVLNDVAYFVAGRCGTMDNGLQLYGVDVMTGDIKFNQNYNDSEKWDRYPKTADLLLSDGKSLIGWGASINIGKTEPTKDTKKFVPQKVFKYGKTWQGPNAILDMLKPMDPAGSYMKSNPSDGKLEGEYIAFDEDRSVVSKRKANDKKEDIDFHYEINFKGSSVWTNTETELHLKAIMLSGSNVFAAGIPEFSKSNGKSALVVLSAIDGKILQKLELENPPSSDGLSTVGGKIIMTTSDGNVICFSNK